MGSNEKGQALTLKSSNDGHSTEKPNVFYIAGVIMFYWLVSFTVVFMNKFLLSNSVYKFPYPLTITWYQLLVSFTILVFASYFNRSVPWLSGIPDIEFDPAIARKVFPMTIIFVGMLSLNNACLKYIEVTFYQVARSLSIIFSAIFTYVILQKTTSKRAIYAMIIIIAGFILGSYGEVRFSWTGSILGVCASMFVALYGIYVKKTLSYLDNNQWRLLNYNTILALIVLIPLIYLTGEYTFTTDPEVYFLGEPYFWATQTITGIAGFAINVAIFVQIKVTTPLTNTISGTAKACVQTLLAWMIFRNPISTMNFIGIVLSLVGSGMYSWVRYLQISS